MTAWEWIVVTAMCAIPLALILWRKVRDAQKIGGVNRRLPLGDIDPPMPPNVHYRGPTQADVDEFSRRVRGRNREDK